MVDHLFRHESGKLVSVLTGIFGSGNIDLAEDVVQDSLLEAMNQWQYKGAPDNPGAWLFRVAKNKALNILNREKYKRKYAAELRHDFQSGLVEPVSDELFSGQHIHDDQLKMIFTCCHPAISSDSQIALSLKTLCGFSIPEIAKAFLTTEDNIQKRLVRARQKIRDDNISFDLPHGNDLGKRLQAVLETIYLLFNEGYSASTGNDLIRYELCEEAIRLARIITDHEMIRSKGSVFALLSLMFLNASRFTARQDRDGNLLTLAEQDRTLWDNTLSSTGFYYLQQATENKDTSIYYFLAAISAAYCTAPDYASTDWSTILTLYNNLIHLDHSPVILLNRAIVLSKVTGIKNALAELELIKNNPAIRSYHLFYSTQAEFYIQLQLREKAIQSLTLAIQLAPLQAEKQLLQLKLDTLHKK